MGRKLPWEIDTHGKAPKLQSATSRPVSAIAQTASPAVSDNDDSKVRAGLKHDILSTPRTRHVRVKSRTPSTSPPPGPPPISPLRAGYENDDIWMMVEDEFYSVAQSYTAHLHHAEYKRLMRKAKEAPPPREISDLSPSKPREVRDRVRREALRERQRTALKGDNAGSFDEDDEDESGKAGSDPWAGTTLAGLMRDGSQNKISLIGLERLPSSTRAAKGYGKGRTESQRKRNDDEVDTIAETSVKRGNQQTLQDMLEDDIFSGGNYEDHGLHNKTATGRSDRFRRERAHNDMLKPQLANVSRRQTNSAGRMRTANNSHPVGGTKRSLIDELEDEVDDIIFGPPSSSPPLQTTWLKTTNADRSKKADQRAKIESKDRRSRLDEVPTFLA